MIYKHAPKHRILLKIDSRRNMNTFLFFNESILCNPQCFCLDILPSSSTLDKFLFKLLDPSKHNKHVLNNVNDDLV